MIAEDEAEVIRVIYDRYIHTNEGVDNVAKYLNDHGYAKKIRQNGTIPGFSDHFVKKGIDNPVYMGKISYGRRRTEKKIGTRNEMHVVEQSKFPVYDGIHEAIISEADWNLAQEKRKKNAYRREKGRYMDMNQYKIGRFIAEKTEKMTQEALGEKLAVANKTASR